MSKRLVNVTSKEMSYDQVTFQPVIKVTAEIPLQAYMDEGVKQMTVLFQTAVGKDFIESFGECPMANKLVTNTMISLA